MFPHFSARFEVELNNMPRKLQRSLLIYICKVVSSCIIFDGLWLICSQFSTNFAFKKDLDWSVAEDCTGCQKCFLDMITLGNLAH